MRARWRVQVVVSRHAALVPLKGDYISSLLNKRTRS